MSCAVVKVSPDQPLRMVVEMLTDYPMHRVLVLKTTIFLDSSVHLTCCNRLRAGALEPTMEIWTQREANDARNQQLDARHHV
jgi:hypothetical protein